MRSGYYLTLLAALTSTAEACLPSGPSLLESMVRDGSHSDFSVESKKVEARKDIEEVLRGPQVSPYLFPWTKVKYDSDRYYAGKQIHRFKYTSDKGFCVYYYCKRDHKGFRRYAECMYIIVLGKRFQYTLFIKNADGKVIDPSKGFNVIFDNFKKAK